MPTVSGVVTDDSGSPAARTVRLYDRATGTMINKQISNAGDGTYSMYVATTNEVDVVVLDDETVAPIQNDLVERVIPGGVDTFPSWDLNTAAGILDILNELKCNRIKGFKSQFFYDIGTFSATNYHTGFTMANNGKLYAGAYSGDECLEFDPETGAFAQFGTVTGSTGIYKFQAGMLAPNGCIYYIPYYTGGVTILKIDPTTPSLSEFGTFASASYKWGNPVIAPNGNIYAAPYNNVDVLKVLKVDTSIDTALEIGASIKTQGSQWTSGALAPNGKIYFPPFCGDVMLVLDTSDDSMVLVSGFPVDDSKWATSTLALDGFIYAMPAGAGTDKILKIDPSDNSWEYAATITDTTYQAHLLPDGCIYCDGVMSGDYWSFDPSDLSIVNGEVTSLNGMGFSQHVTIAEDGCLYTLSTVLDEPVVARFKMWPDQTAKLNQNIILNQIFRPT